MIILRLICLGVLITNTAGSREREEAALAAKFFFSKTVRMVTSTFCHQESNIWLHKQLSRKGIAFDCLDLRTINESEVVERLTSKFFVLGVFVDLKCPRAMELLHLSEKHRLFSLGRSLTSWLVVGGRHVSREILEASAKSQAPKVDDPLTFLVGPYRDRKNEKHLLKINKQVNMEFLKLYEKSRGRAMQEHPPSLNQTEVDYLWSMQVLLDAEMTLAIPRLGDLSTSYDLYSFYRLTPESKPKIIKVGKAEFLGGGDGLSLAAIERRQNLEGALLRAASAIFQPEAFTTIDDLATRESDLWSKMSYEHVKLLAEDLNFRVIIRFFDDYGWQTNGTFGHLMGFLQEKKADLSAAGLLMRTERFDVVQFLLCPFRLQGIWFSIGIVILIAAVVLRCRGLIGKNLLSPDRNISSFLDVGDYIVGAVCQQGFSTTPESLPERISIFVLLLTSLALFTSYSACIVALLQSSSSAISSISDITQSDLEVGIQANFPLYKVLIKEAVHPVLTEFYRRKVVAKGERAFCDRREGIEKMRTGMFAFEVELTAGYKLISETYEEREKCGIKEIDLVPKPFICMAVQKFSPYKEIFAQRLVRQNEAGLFDRSWKLWVDQKPKCEVGRIGFISVGLAEFKPALQVFASGVGAAVVLLFLELLSGKKIRPRYLTRRNS